MAAGVVGVGRDRVAVGVGVEVRAVEGCAVARVQGVARDSGDGPARGLRATPRRSGEQAMSPENPSPEDNFIVRIHTVIGSLYDTEK